MPLILTEDQDSATSLLLIPYQKMLLLLIQPSDPEEDDKVRNEKEEIYAKCIPYYDEKYAATFGKCKWKVRGLWFGSRGTVGKSVTDFFNELKLDSDKIKDLSEDILIRTIKIINNHIYS